ncbi:MAG: TolC family protein [Rhodothermaceae bacterium]|nr:TolC family protein [Rhodothermaceae bacterium]
MTKAWYSRILTSSLVWLVLIAFIASPVWGQEKETYQIGILADLISPESEFILTQMETEIQAVVGEDAIIEFPTSSMLVNNLDEAQAERNYQALLENDTDIILAFGPLNSKIISAQESFEKPTILFGAINLDLIAIAESEQTSGIDNFNYLVTSGSYTEDLETFQSIYSYDYVGILVAGGLETVLDLESVFSRVASEVGIAYTLIPYTDPSSIEPHLDTIDAVYLAEGFFLGPGDIEALAQQLIEWRLPSFTSTFREDVEAGLLATNQSDDNLAIFFRRIALNVESVVNGTNLGDLPISLETSPTLTINFNTAERVGVPIKYSSVATTEYVGNFENVMSEKTYSLVDLMEAVVERNLLLELSEKEVNLTEQDVKLARSNYLPDASASATGSYVDEETAELSNGQNPEYSTSGNITVSQTVFSEAANANIDIQESLLNAEKANYSATELDLILNASMLYFNTLIVKANLQIRSENLSVTRENLQIAEQNFEAGQSGRADILRFNSEMAQNMQALIEAVNQLEQAFHSINELLNYPVDREIDVEEAAIGEGVFEGYSYEFIQQFVDDPNVRKNFVDFLVLEAQRNAPELASIEYSLEATDRTILLNGSRRFLPTVALQAQYNRTFDQWGVGVPPPEFFLRDNFSVGVNVSVPIFNRNQNSINRQSAIIQREQLKLNEENTNRTIERDVRDIVLDLVNQIASIELSAVSEESARESLDLIRTAYSSGSATLVQVLDAQNNLVQAQLARANASYNYLLTSLILERYIGYYFLLHTEEENTTFQDRFFDYMTTLE